MLHRLLQTDRDYAVLGLRLVFALTFFPHGAQKLLGWYGGFGIDGTLDYLASLGVPTLLGLLLIANEFFGMVALAAGLASRVTAFGTLVSLLGAVLLVHGQFGFFINWLGTQQGEGIQFHLLAAVVAITLMVKGGGAWSLDQLLVSRWRKAAPARLPDAPALRAA